MGVKELWPILEPVKSSKSFENMRGETLAIDLSMWIVDSQCVKQMVGTVTNPHLRNLFFRTSSLLQAGILPVFVVEGDAPELKWQTMADRQQVRHGNVSHGKGKVSARRANRSHFNSVIRECCEMLDYLGVSHIQSSGEAEATCAALNSCGLVDAVITEDGDAFLYGAKTVYRNFTTTKTPSVDSYNISDIEKDVQLHRNHLIALGLMVGCDYCPKGVPGVGRMQAMKLCEEIPQNHILKKMLHWSTKGLYGDETLHEKVIATKIARMDSSNFGKIIDEFMNADRRTPFEISRWKKPLIAKAQNYNLRKLEWPINYSLEKMLPLLTLWSMRCVANLVISPSDLSIKLERIVKKRVRHGVDCLEVLWEVNDLYEVDESGDKQPCLLTIETCKILQECFPAPVREFLTSKPAKPKRTRAKAKTLSENAISTMKILSIEKHTAVKRDSKHDNPKHLSTFPLDSNKINVVSKGDDPFDDSLHISQVTVEDCPDTVCSSIDIFSKLTQQKMDSQYADGSVISLSDDDSLLFSSAEFNDGRPREDSEVEQLEHCLSSSLTLNNPDSCVPTLQSEKQLHQSINLFSASLVNSHFTTGNANKPGDAECPLTTNDGRSMLVENVSPRRPVKCDSIDMLLADISDQLKTPIRSPLKEKHFHNRFTPRTAFDRFLTGHMSPKVDEKVANSKFPYVSGEENSTSASIVSDVNFDLNESALCLSGDFTDSDISLFSVASWTTPANRSRRPSITKSTPLDSVWQGVKCANVSDSECDSGPLCHVTYGDFDVVPQLSALSFDE